MSKKIFYHITFGAITENLGSGLQIDTCQGQGIEVQILDISSIFNFPMAIHSDKYSSLVKKINNIKEFEEIVKKSKPENTFFNVQFAYEFRFKKIFKLIAKYPNYKWGMFLFGQLPFQRPRNLFLKTLKTPPHKILGKIFNRVLGKLCLTMGMHQIQNYIFFAGETQRPYNHHQKAFCINYFDYDAFLEDPIPTDENYTLFLDEGLFQHPDDQIVGNKINNDLIQNYQKNMNRFFDYYEKEIGQKIIIACHPKIDYPENYFGNRTCIRYKTKELVKNAHHILCHSSTSITFAIAYKKPITFLVENTILEFSKSNQNLNESITHFSELLGCPKIDISSPNNFSKESITNIIDPNRYENFTLNYVTTNKSKNILSKILFTEYLKQIF